MTQMDGRVAVVVGAARGIGRATAAEFLQRGAHTVLLDVSEAVAGTGEELSSEFGAERVTAARMDVTDAEQVARTIETVIAEQTKIDVLACVAGVNQEAFGVSELPPEVWQRIFDVNVTGPFNVCRAVVPHMTERGYGRIVTVASWWAYSGHAYFSAYCASKSALRSFTQSLAEEVASHGVTVNAVCPGNINTSMHTDALVGEAEKRGISFEEMREIEWTKIPMGKPGEPDDIARAIGWLASDDAGYITGASLDVNGGVVFN